MFLIFKSATIALALSAMLVVSTRPSHARVESGLLTCEVSGGFALIVSSPRELHCVFQKVNGQSEAYGGRIQEFGLDIGVTGGGVIAWSVTADSTEVPPGELAGRYGGAEVGGSVVVGAEGRALVGGSQRTISLQPLSIEGDVGLNIAVGIATLELYPLFRAAPTSVQVRTPAVGHSYASVPHAYQAPHYGCGSYTHLMHGQTLYGLAHACGVTLEALLEANPQIADVRNVPTRALVHVPSHVNSRTASSCGQRAVLQDGESLEQLAWRCGVTLHALLLTNSSVRDMSVVQPGLVLFVPAQRPKLPAPPVIYAKMETDQGAASSRQTLQANPAGRSAEVGSIRTERVRFRAGQTGTSISGRIAGYESVSYVLDSEAGQTMTVTLRSRNTSTYFNIYEPGKGPGDQALAVSSNSGPMVPALNSFKAALPASGRYTVSVYLYRNAARQGERSDYDLDISISARSPEAGLPPVRSDYADGLQGGPDYWAVKLADQASSLGLRTMPSTASREIGGVSNGAVLRNLGCRTAEGRRWCYVETISAPKLSGWTFGESLRESNEVAAQPRLSETVGGGTNLNSTGRVSAEAKNACLNAARNHTKESIVSILSSEFSQANSQVMVGVGAQKAPWRCLVSNSGRVSEIMFAGSDSGGVQRQGAAHQLSSGSQTSGKAKSACLSAARSQTKESNVTILSSEFSQANSQVMVGVGAQKAPWRCLVSNDGRVSEIMFAGNDSGGVQKQGAAPQLSSGSQTSDKAKIACLSAVRGKTKESDVSVLSSEFSQANSQVMVGVGAQKAPWRCLVSNDGRVSEIMFAGSDSGGTKNPLNQKK
jgi:Protein of unknown function (DUF992)/LysM domain